MSLDIDAILLDRVFQPSVDRSAGWVSAFGLARAALVLAVEAQALTLLWDVVRDVSAGNLLFVGVAAALTVVGAQQAWTTILRAERQSRAGTLNVRRITLRRQRLTWLGVCACCTLALAPLGDIRAVSATVGCLAWVALIYFVSCTPSPGAGRRAPWNAVVRAPAAG